MESVAGPDRSEAEFQRAAPSQGAVIEHLDLSEAATGRGPSLDMIGQRDEVVRQRINEMTDRLEDLKTLHGDFASIMGPLAKITNELPRANRRISELEALLAQEQQAVGVARRENSELTRQSVSTENLLQAALARCARHDAASREQAATIEELRVALRDKSLTADNLERQLSGEAERVQALTGENKALRLEAQAVDQALARVAHELAETRERLNIADQDNRRLQLVSEEQSAKLVELGARHHELVETASADQQRLRLVEAQLATETAMRERSQTQYETEIGVHRTERASLAMKLEAALSRTNSTEQLLTQVRNQLRERDEAARAFERGLKEAGIERVTADRRVESLQADLARQIEHGLELQRIRAELDGRCDMLMKAVAAKDAAIDQGFVQASALSDRIDQLTHRYETERSELELTNRRLIEELQNERAERTMAQGALDIARESRISLQKQYEALKRSARGWRESAPVDDGAPGAEPDDGPARAKSNVRPFSSPAKNG